MATVIGQIPCYLVILGDGERRGSLEKLVAELGLEAEVFLPGYRKNVYKYFGAADLFVLSSNYEGMPNVLVEALACGLPAVATRCKSGPSEILRDGDGGELVPPDDSDALAEAIVSALREPEATEKRRRVALQALDRYEISRIEDKYDDMLRRLV